MFHFCDHLSCSITGDRVFQKDNVVDGRLESSKNPEDELEVERFLQCINGVKHRGVIDHGRIIYLQFRLYPALFHCIGKLEQHGPRIQLNSIHEELSFLSVKQFTSKDFTDMLKDRHVAISMDGKGRVFDNIFIERLWRTVKYEEVYLKDYANVTEAIRS